MTRRSTTAGIWRSSTRRRRGSARGSITSRPRSCSCRFSKTASWSTSCRSWTRSRTTAPQQVDTLWDEVKRFDNPHTYYVDLSQKLWDIKDRLLHEGGRRRTIKDSIRPASRTDAHLWREHYDHSRGDHRAEFCRRLDAGGDGAGAGAAPGGDLFQNRGDRAGSSRRSIIWTPSIPIWRLLPRRTRLTRPISPARTAATLNRPCACCGTASTCCWKSRAF